MGRFKYDHIKRMITLTSDNIVLYLKSLFASSISRISIPINLNTPQKLRHLSGLVGSKFDLHLRGQEFKSRLI